MSTQEDLKLKAKKLLRTATDASKKLEESVRELVTMRAWSVLGYKDFSEMWEKENGYACPQFVKILAANVLMDEGMNTATGLGPGRVPLKPNGHTSADIGKAVGYHVGSNGHGSEYSSAIVALKAQREHGVPVDRQVASYNRGLSNKAIDTYGTRARSQPRRMGKTLDELVSEGFTIPRRDADAISEIARDANVPKSEIYRQAVNEYLMRYRASRPVSFSGGTK